MALLSTGLQNVREAAAQALKEETAGKVGNPLLLAIDEAPKVTFWTSPPNLVHVGYLYACALQVQQGRTDIGRGQDVQREDHRLHEIGIGCDDRGRGRDHLRQEMMQGEPEKDHQSIFDA